MLNSRVNNLATLSNGSTTADAELIDIRTGYDSELYDSAGEAVRTQISNINNFYKHRISEFDGKLNLFNKDTFIPDKEINKYTGEYMENNKGYGVSDFIPVNAGDELYFSRNGSSFNVTFLYNYGFDKTIVYDSRISVINNYTVPVGTAFIRVCIKTIEISDFQIELDSISSYKPFITLENIFSSLNEDIDTINNDINSLNNFYKHRVSEFDGKLNLFNKDTFIPDKEINQTTGEPMNNSNGCGISDFIPVNAGDKLYFSKNNTETSIIFIYTYDGNFRYINTPGSLIKTFTVPNGVSFIRICIETYKIFDLQIEFDSISPYKPFITLEKVYESSKTNKNKVNLITNKFLILNDILSKNLFNKDTFMPDKEINKYTGEYMENNKGYGVSDFIPVNAGDELYFSRNGVEFTVTYLYTYNESFQCINRPGTLIKTFTVPNGVSFIKVCVENSKISDFQIELDEITAYKPYGILKSAFDSSIDYNEEPLQTIEDYPTFLSCFLNVGCIGDSLASGVAVYKDNNGDPVVNSVNRYEYSWGKYLARMTGNTYYNWSKGGLRTDTFLSSSYATECFDGNHLCQAYIIGLCQNDNNANHGSDIGTINDIYVSDYNNNENTFYGRYGKIIQKIKEVNPKAKIFCITDPNTNVNDNGYNTAIRNIVSVFNNTYVIDLQAYWNNIPFKTLLDNQKRYGHFNAVGYYLIAKIIMSYIDYIIEKNPDDFREIENIGTNYYWY